LAATAEDVAERIAHAVRTGRELVYSPPLLRPVMSGLRHLPRAVFRRLPV
jgi:decaprenylphospho-beta-D-erythro-pentofuranosid-2-ulose 2-reductase